jgi:hypothetical protein
MIKQTVSKFALALAVTLIFSNSAIVFAQHGGTDPDPTGQPGNGVIFSQHGGTDPDPTGQPGNGVIFSQHGGTDPDPTGQPGNGVALHSK